VSPLTISFEEHLCPRCKAHKMFVHINGGRGFCLDTEQHDAGTTDHDDFRLLQRRYDDASADATNLRLRLAHETGINEKLTAELATASKREGATVPELPKNKRNSSSTLGLPSKRKGRNSR